MYNCFPRTLNEGNLPAFFLYVPNSTQGGDITVCSLNVRGLSNNQKRRETFFTVEKNPEILYLFLTRGAYSPQEKQKAVGNPNGGIFTNFSSSRAGVGILFNNNFHFQISKCFVDPEGRFIIADTGDLQDKMLTLVNIYAPNKDEPTFFQNVGEKLSSFDCDFMIFGSDFNLVCDIHKAKKGGIPTTHSKSRDEVEILKENFELTDIWRVLNPDATRFTWRTRKKPRNSMSFRFFSY